MKVKELIEALEECEQDQEVVIDVDSYVYSISEDIAIQSLASYDDETNGDSIAVLTTLEQLGKPRGGYVDG